MMTSRAIFRRLNPMQVKRASKDAFSAGIFCFICPFLIFMSQSNAVDASLSGLLAWFGLSGLACGMILIIKAIVVLFSNQMHR